MDSILAFLNNQQVALVCAMLVPFLYKYLPVTRNLSNGFCTLLAAASAWAANVFAPPAHAAIFGGALASFGTIFIPFVDALITKLFHDHIFNPAYKAMGLKPPSPTQ